MHCWVARGAFAWLAVKEEAPLVPNQHPKNLRNLSKNKRGYMTATYADRRYQCWKHTLSALRERPTGLYPGGNPRLIGGLVQGPPGPTNKQNPKNKQIKTYETALKLVARGLQCTTLGVHRSVRIAKKDPVPIKETAVLVGLYLGVKKGVNPCGVQQ